MKAKRIILAAAAALICCGAFAQTMDDLAGTWHYHDVDDTDGDICEYNEYFDFSADGSCVTRGDMYMELNMDDEGKLHAKFTYSANGVWSLADGIITYKFDAKSIKLVQDNENNMPGLLKTMLFNPMMNEMKKQIKKRSPSRIISYESSKMILKDTEGKENTEDLYIRE